MSREYYTQLKKADIMKSPKSYAWNCLLFYVQFTQEELLQVKSHLAMPELIRYQKALTRDFLNTHFSEEIDACLEVDWLDVEKYVPE